MNYKFCVHSESCSRISESILQSEHLDRLVEMFCHANMYGELDLLFDSKKEINLADFFESIAAEKRRVMRLLSLSIAYLAKAYRAVIVNRCNVFVRDRHLLASHYYVYINSDDDDHQFEPVCNQRSIDQNTNSIRMMV